MLSRTDCGLPQECRLPGGTGAFGDNFDIPAFAGDKAHRLYVSGNDAAEINAWRRWRLAGCGGKPASTNMVNGDVDVLAADGWICGGTAGANHRAAFLHDVCHQRLLTPRGAVVGCSGETLLELWQYARDVMATPNRTRTACNALVRSPIHHGVQAREVSGFLTLMQIGARRVGPSTRTTLRPWLRRGGFHHSGLWSKHARHVARL